MEDVGHWCAGGGMPPRYGFAACVGEAGKKVKLLLENAAAGLSPALAA